MEEQHARPLDAEARERREAELRRTLRDPAISYLRRARGADTSPDYVEALIALTELRFDDAIAHGEAAFRDVPTLYEAGLMVANALSRKATDALRAGEERQAAALQDRMLAMYQRVADIGRSDERVYRHYADYVGFLAYQRWENGEDVEAEFTRAVELATKGQAADSEAVWADEMIARILWAMGQNDRRHQRDPRPRLVASLAAGAQALARDPRSANAFMYLGNAWSTLAEMWEEPHGIDPRPSLEKSIAAFEAAQSIAPDPEGYANVAASYAQLAHWQMAHGVDPISSVEVGVRSYKEAFRMLPDDMPDAHPNACNLLSDMASHLISLGRDPEPWFARAEPDCAAGKREAPGLPFAFEVAARFEGLRAVAAWRAGRDPMPFWERSLPDFEAALKLDPRREDFRADLASSLAERADFATAHGLDATEAVARALAEARRAVGIDETSPYALRALARASLAAARARVRAGKDPSAAVAEGTQAAERALGQNRDDGEALMVAAELHLVAAPRRPRATGPGLALTARSLALNPGNTRALAIRAGFERLAGDHALADATLAAALAAGPLLANDPVAAR